MSGLPNLSRLVEQATPGPWKKFDRRISVVVDSEHFRVCDIMGASGGPRVNEDADLIAAAPAMAQLLLACEEELARALLAWDEGLMSGWGVVDRVRDALARLADFDRGIT